MFIPSRNVDLAIVLVSALVILANLILAIACLSFTGCILKSHTRGILSHALYILILIVWICAQTGSV